MIDPPAPGSGSRRVLLATLGIDSLDALAVALAAQGEQVAVLAEAAEPTSPEETLRIPPGIGTVRRFQWQCATREATQQSVEVLLAQAGEPTQVVVHALPSAALAGGAVVEHDDAGWHAACGAAMLQSLHLLQVLAPALKTRRASIVFVGASLSLVGAERLAGLVTLLESQRGLMKSLARQWGRHGVTCNWVALEARELWPGFADFKLPMRLEATPVALGRRPNAGPDLAGVLDYLASPAGRAVTGSTLCLDCGEWMVP
jgi:3-oxoacyl-[acyl-carrier protein] reductase